VEPCFNYPSIIMSTWITVIGRIAQIEGISNSSYKNALVEFEEGDSDLSTCRCFYVAFWGDVLESGRNYVIFGTGRLTGNEDCSQPKVRFLISPYDNVTTFFIYLPYLPTVHLEFGSDLLLSLPSSTPSRLFRTSYPSITCTSS
jgi:hypothetical protein